MTTAIAFAPARLWPAVFAGRWCDDGYLVVPTVGGPLQGITNVGR